MAIGYNRLAGQSTDLDESFELAGVSDLKHARSSRGSESYRKPHAGNGLFMPSHIHEQLNAYKDGTAGDSDSETDSSERGYEKYASYGDDGGPLSGTKDSLLKKAKAELLPDGDSDLEGRAPAWASHKVTENNVLKRRLALPTILVLILVVLAAFFAGHSSISSRSSNVYKGLKKKVTVDDVLSGTFFAHSQSLDWLAEAGDGVYSFKLSDGSIALHDIGANKTRLLVKGSQVVNHAGTQLDYQTFSVSHDLRYILFGADREPLWRHSSRSNFWVHDLETARTIALTERATPSRTAIAKWAPQGHSIAYVQDNDLYVTTSSNFSSPIRVTHNGNETIFNGVPDWAYEEEVFGSDSASWWSPDGKKLAFLSMDESEVQVYSFPVYNPDRFQPGAAAYPSSVDMRYPKPGTPNPKVSVYIFDLEAYQAGQEATSSYELVTQDPLDIHNRVVTEVAWVGPDDLIVRETTRSAARERVSHFDFSKRDAKGRVAQGLVTRDVDFAKRDGGWAEVGQTVYGLDTSLKTRPGAGIPRGYLDVIPDSKGYNHVAFFSPPDAAEAVFLTSGEWEVDGTLQAVDLQRNLIYFIAANPSTDRHLFSIPLPSITELESIRKGSSAAQPGPMTDTSEAGFYGASFSPEGGFYLLHQQAGLPWQRLYNVANRSNEVLSLNVELNNTLSGYQVPRTSLRSMKVEGGAVLNVAETVPPNLDTSGRTKYPVLFRPYGGPNSQTVQSRYRVDFTHALASELGCIVVEVDGRGTGFRGRAFRSVVRGNLGEAEAQDQIAVAKQYAQLPYVDEGRIGIQGWSYGGYLAAKVIEANSSVFSLGISIAPVTDWRYYDTIYTERYMDTLEANAEGYKKSAVMEMDGFRHADYLLVHGSGDDNVHYLNTAALLDKLTWAGITKFRFRMFTDSAHSMNVRGAYRAVHQLMKEFLAEKLGGPERQKHSHERR